MGTPLAFARRPEELTAELSGEAPALAIVDLTATGADLGAVLDTLAAASVPVLGYTTHTLARHTQPLHARCARVITKEALTRELADILREGTAA